jgi:hypothetical protein
MFLLLACTPAPKEGPVDGPPVAVHTGVRQHTGAVESDPTGATASTGHTGAGGHSAVDPGLEVLLVHGSTRPSVDDVEAGLLAAGVVTVDRVDGSRFTPTVTDLAAYDAVLVWSDQQWRDRVALGDALGAYADAGGGVVVATFALAEESQPAGRFLPYVPILPASAIAGDVSLVALEPTSPLLVGVGALETGSAYVGGASVAAGAQPVAEWSDGTALLAEWSIDGAATVVAVNLYPPSAAAFFLSWRGDGGVLLANALQFAANNDGTPIPRALRGWAHGVCDGLVWIHSGMGTPGVAHEVWLGSPGGPSPAPSGPCAGTALPLASPVLEGAPVADAAGNTERATILTASCGVAAVVVDTATCGVSDGFTLP